MMTVTSLNSHGNISFFIHRMKYDAQLKTARKIKKTNPFLHNKSMKRLYSDALSSDVSLICRQNIFLSFNYCCFLRKTFKAAQMYNDYDYDY